MTGNSFTGTQRTSRAALALRSYGIVVALVILVVIIAIIQPNFLAFGNLMNIVSQWSPVAIMGIGMTYVVITGGFDLSIGAVYTLCAVIAAAVGRTEAPIVAFALAITVGLAVGVINGLVVTGLRVNAFIATLGTQLIITGLTLVLTGNAAFIVTFDQFKVLGAGRAFGIPYSGMLMVALMIIGGLILAYTPFGQAIYAVGGNKEASRLAGIPTSTTIASSYAIAGLCAGIAGTVSASQLSSAQANLNPTIVFDVLTVVIVGGTLLTGGSGAIWRTAVGVGILAALQNGFNLLNVSPYYQDIIKGIIIIAAIAQLDWRRLLGPSMKREVAAERPEPTRNKAEFTSTLSKETS
ncbi:MAG: Monosaccharide transporter rane protein family [Subtercola sp.]|jgi:ribose transport system permease protein|nr:Monosaccharide transporter rane protein family [Subtercola sp.]